LLLQIVSAPGELPPLLLERLLPACGLIDDALNGRQRDMRGVVGARDRDEPLADERLLQAIERGRGVLGWHVWIAHRR